MNKEKGQHLLILIHEFEKAITECEFQHDLYRLYGEEEQEKLSEAMNKKVNLKIEILKVIMEAIYEE